MQLGLHFILASVCLMYVGLFLSETERRFYAISFQLCYSLRH